MISNKYLAVIFVWALEGFVMFFGTFIARLIKCMIKYGIDNTGKAIDEFGKFVDAFDVGERTRGDKVMNWIQVITLWPVMTAKIKPLLNDIEELAQKQLEINGKK